MARDGMDTMARAFAQSHPVEAARTLEAMGPDRAGPILQGLPRRVARAVTEHLTPQAAAGVLASIDADRSAELLAEIEPRQAAAILQFLEDELREKTLAGATARRAKLIRGMLQFPSDSAGAMMETRITSLRIDMRASEAVSRLRRAPRTTLYYLYVVDADGRLAGVLNLRDLLLASPRDPIEPLVRRELVTVPATMPRDEVVALVRKHRFVAIPVVDADGFLMGVVRPDEILGALQEEAFVDLQKMVGAGGEERALSPVSVVVRKRLPWLYVNLATAFLAAAVVGLFEGVIQQVTALAVLLPVVAGQGGNTGAQALAVVMRGIALRELEPGSTRRLLFKETFGATINGTLVAIGTGVAVWFWDGRVGLALVIFISMIVNMAAAGLAGAAIPLALRAAGRDPAQSASIFLTTVTDVVGFAAFLGCALLFMPMLQ